MFGPPLCGKAALRRAAGPVIAVPLLTGAVSLIVAGGGGLFWIVGGMVVAILGAVFNAWVLLIEILR